MFEAAVRDRSNELVLKKEIAETGRVDANVAALLVGACLISCEAALCRARSAVGGRLGGLDLLVGVVDKVLLVRHGGISTAYSGVNCRSGRALDFVVCAGSRKVIGQGLLQ